MAVKASERSRVVDPGVKMTKPPKDKGKEKLRKQLWDSILSFYEEAGTDNVEEVDISEVDDWACAHPNDSYIALSQVVQSNPQLISAAFPIVPEAYKFKSGNIENEMSKNFKKKRNISVCKSSKTEKRSGELRKKRMRNTSMNKSSGVGKTTRNKLPKGITRKLNKSVSNSSVARSRVKSGLIKKKKNSSISKNIVKKKSLITGKSTSIVTSTNTNSTTIKKPQKRPKSQIQKSSEQLSEVNTLLKERKRQIKSLPLNLNIVQVAAKVEHKCNLKLKPFNEAENFIPRSDGRVFKCQLIFKVCECFESDETF